MFSFTCISVTYFILFAIYYGFFKDLIQKREPKEIDQQKKFFFFVLNITESRNYLLITAKFKTSYR
ncbi:hypothetical protein AAJ76_1280006980 [Vairimorpha ceranae]|uniref:Uncharacterized protein n=1 Tax=Vairimorpha ceranae TaxID=40302 RepID=A0A0F9WLU7_9MICR|nr:hypothetical protein AAJ76_1280006980 [Vairimorpha ceranae]KKO74053.1 hypothetical protein AAJ76_1280006980 [Vairimorpha ceranae]